jgi:EAL domain-containing protein (putative c-di-GMP-specific phosphodiesterase class I)/CheY-like chemotaxis protein
MSRVLVVEDEPAVRAVMERALLNAGHDVIAVEGGQSALDVAWSTSIDAAVVDYRIPPPNGLELLSQLRQVQPLSARILVSGWLDLGLTMSAVNRCEISRVLRKPCEPAVLVDAVAESIRERSKLHCWGARPSAPGLEQLGAQVDECFEAQALHLALQPIVTRAGHPVAYEALLRSAHPTLSTPLVLLDAAERAGRLGVLGDVVVAHAVEVLSRLPGSLRLFINLHPQDLAGGLIERQLAPLRPFAQRVVLEVTERARIDATTAQQTAKALRDLGFDLAIDDLGSGYSSLSLLVALKPRYIKVDISIVREIQLDPDKRHLMELICRFAETAGQVVIAEGIETEDEAQVARECGAALLQGYMFGVPQRWGSGPTAGLDQPAAPASNDFAAAESAGVLRERRASVLRSPAA